MNQRQRKEVGLLAIICEGKLLLQSVWHSQGYEILSVPGVPKTRLSEKIADLLGKEYVGKEQPFGSFTDLIIKPDGDVELTGEVFRVEISNNDEVAIPEKFGWYTKEQIETDPRCKRDCRFYARLLEPKPLNLTYSEDQREQWIDAKILSWNEKEAIVRRQ